MKQIKKMSIIILILIIILSLLCIIGLLVGGDRVLNLRKEKILKAYRNNENSFLNSVNEILLEKNNIFFEISNKKITIEICVEDNNKANGFSYINIDDKDYYKYNETLKLMKKLNIIRIIKDIDYIQYNFGSPYGHGQWIIYTKDINNYISEMISNGYEFYRYEKIKENWHFIEES